MTTAKKNREKNTLEADVIQVVAQPTPEDESFLIRVVSPSGKLLFVYNAKDDRIEIKADGGSYAVALRDMRDTHVQGMFAIEEPSAAKVVRRSKKASLEPVQTVDTPA